MKNLSSYLFEGFFNNIVVTPLKKEDGEIIIPEGMKLVKSFKYFKRTIKRKRITSS